MMKKVLILVLLLAGFVAVIIVVAIALSLNVKGLNIIGLSRPSPSVSPSSVSASSFKGEVDGWTVGLLQKSPYDDFQDLILTKRGETRLLGEVMVYGGAESYDIDRKQKRIIFIGKSQENGGQNIAEDIIVYSVESDKTLKTIKWSDISVALKITGHINAGLNRLSVSPNGNSAAASFGYILEADYESRIVVFDLGNGLVKVIPQKGLVKGWKDDNTILYEVETSEKQGGSLYPKKAILPQCSRKYPTLTPFQRWFHAETNMWSVVMVPLQENIYYAS